MKAVIRTLQDLDAFCDKAARDGVITGQPLTVTLENFKRPRTVDQNSKLHVLFRELANHTGYTEKEIKDYFKSEYGPSKAIEIAGEMRVIPKGTSEYTIDELNDMIDRVQQVSAEAT
jgi:hypothetical protein